MIDKSVPWSSHSLKGEGDLWRRLARGCGFAQENDGVATQDIFDPRNATLRQYRS